jgi:hypothetical protein
MNPGPTSLERLLDIIAPPPAPWWPPPPGWYWVLVFLLFLVLVLVFRFFRLWQQNRYRREALAELARHEAALADPDSISAMGELLKRAALTAFPRDQVARLTGPAWFTFLDRTGRTTAFSAGSGATRKCGL